MFLLFDGDWKLAEFLAHESGARLIILYDKSAFVLSHISNN